MQDLTPIFRLYAMTVTTGDPPWGGALAGVALALPVYHVTEDAVKANIPRALRRALGHHGDGHGGQRHRRRGARHPRGPGLTGRGSPRWQVTEDAGG